ncbi:MAG: amino acid permease [Gammaproteobacteria bacterium]|nr:MAG: amino acid permease [Gammaproteobacteria bacterium]UTW41986.1 amino acid permease [bacterium SCSIO 12844]
MNPSTRNAIAKLSVFSVAMITITSVDSIRNLPGSALFGSHTVFFFLLAGICYFIPTALVCAELSTTYPEQGGVYLWGKKTLGKPFGFVTLWYQYAENLVFYPPLLSFIIATAVYPFASHLTDSNLFIFFAINIVFWTITLINIRGLQISAIFTNICGILGLVIPMLLICSAGIYWFSNPSLPSQIQFNQLSDWIPDFSNLHLGAAFTAVVLSLTGMEITTAYANEVKNPQKNYPRALLIATFFILLTLTIGSLSIATIIAPTDSTLSSGIMVAFSAFFNQLHLSWVIPLIAIGIVLGGLAGLNNWIIAPTKGLHAAAKDGFLPKVFTYENKKKAPTVLLITQGIITSLLSLIFIFVPNVNAGMWVLNILMTQLYMIMYICVFISFIASRVRHRHLHRPFRVPGGIFGVILIAGLGIISSTITIIVSFDFPASVSISTGSYYLFFGLFIFTLPAIAGIYYFSRHSRNHSNQSDLLIPESHNATK